MKCTGVFRRTESACAAEVAGRPLCDGGATVQRQADIVAVHPCGAYVFELNVDESADAALEQVSQMAMTYRIVAEMLLCGLWGSVLTAIRIAC